MSKVISDTVYDAALDRAALANRMHLCNGQPTSWADVLTRSVGALTVNTTHFTKADGDTSGRKLTVAVQSGFSIIRTSTLDHVAFIDSTVFLGATTHPVVAVTSGDARNTNAFDFMEIRDPT